MIAVTGIGIVSALGIGGRQALDALSEGKSGISTEIPREFCLRNVHALGLAASFRPKDFIPAMASRRMSRFSQLAVASAVDAARNAGIEISPDSAGRMGVAVGTGLASTGSTDSFYEGILREGAAGMNPLVFPETVQNIAASHIAIHFGITGPNITFSQSDISSELALSYGCGMLRSGRVDAAIVAGVDEISRAMLSGYSSLMVLGRAMRPFDRERSGFVAAEGGAALLLERYEDARRRNAKIYCSVDGIGIVSSPQRSLGYDATGASLADAMNTALAQAGLGSPGCISAAANSSRDLDPAEAEAISSLFGGRNGIPVTALRGYHGYFPADGILRVASMALCMGKGIIPAIPGLEMPCAGGAAYVRGTAITADYKSALVNSFAPGGGAASVAVKKHE